MTVWCSPDCWESAALAARTFGLMYLGRLKEAESQAQEAIRVADVPGDTMMDRAYSYKLWGAAYVINGGCGDDTFNDFRSSLISRGHSCFERATADPDSLADEPFNETAWFYEGYQYAVGDGVKAVAGMRPRRRHPDRPSGEDWVEADLPELFPRLNAKFT